MITSCEDNILYVDLGKYYRNKQWAGNFGEIQKVIEENNYNNQEINKIVYNLSVCEWADPLPLLSLIIALKTFKEDGGSNIIILPTLSSLYKSKSDKVLKFLEKEGFLKCFKELAIIKNKKAQILTDYDIKKFDAAQIKLSFTESTLLPAEIINVKEIDDNSNGLDNWLTPKINGIRARLINIDKTQEIENLIYKLKIFIGETLHNIKKHAYQPDSKKAYACIYVRMRYGLNNKNLSGEQKKNLYDAIYRVPSGENVNCPRLVSDYLEVKKTFLEVFIIDSGIGMYESIKDIINKNKKVTQYPFREACNAVFIEGKRKTSLKYKDQTYNGGLYTLGQILKKSQDYLCGRDINEWVGDFLPFQYRYSYLDTEAVGNNKAEVRGLAWIARLSGQYQIDKKSKYWTYWDGSPKQNPVYLELGERRSLNSILKFKIIDHRFSGEKIVDSFFHDHMEKHNIKIDNENVLVFVKPYLSKPAVWNLIIDSIGMLEKDNGEKDDTIIKFLLLVDIPENEKDIYIAALNKPFIYNKDIFKKIEVIILITRQLGVCFLEKKEHAKECTFEIDTEKSFQFYSETKFIHKDIQIDRSIQDAFSVIRLHDSLLFWLNLKNKNAKSQMFVKGEIKCNTELLNINYFLDFSQTLADNLLKELYLIQLERCIGFFPEGVCLFKNMDILTENLITEINTKIEKEGELSNNLINIGSVFVTGNKEKEALYGAVKTNNTLNIHFFVHGESMSQPSSLFIWPKKEWIENNKIGKNVESFERVGKSHVIAKHGYMYFPIPRYDNLGNSIYYRNPSDTYNDWQSFDKKLITIGNYSYNGYSDLFNIDIRKAVSLAFEYKEPLAEFLISEFFLALHGYNASQLNDNHKNYWESSIKDRFFEYDHFYDKIAAIVYLNHFNTSIVIDYIKEFIKPSLTQNIFALTPVNNYRSGSALLFSPLVFESIKNCITDKRSEILFFDDTIISGRSRKEIKHFLLGLGVSEVKTLTILDRNRLPFNTPKKEKHKSFWRLDLPRMRSENSNPINKVLTEINQLNIKLVSPTLLSRINSWKKIWGKRSQNNNDQDYGIAPIALNSSYKRFGVEKDPPHNQIGGENNKILLINSIGLSLYAAEIHAMTGRNDIALKIIDKEEKLNSEGKIGLTNEVKIELISSQLLLFENEYPADIHFQMLRELLNASLGIIQKNNHTCLASIVLLSQNDFYLEQILQEFSKKISYSNNNMNDDIKLFLLYLYDKNDRFREKYLREWGKELLYEEFTTLKALYQRLQFSIYAESGVLHDRPIIQLINNTAVGIRARIVDAAKSFREIKFILTLISSCNLRNDYKIIDSTNEYINEKDLKTDTLNLKKCLESLLGEIFDELVELSEIKNSNNEFNIEDNFIGEKANEVINNIKIDIVGKLRLIHSALVYPISTKSQRPNERPLNKKMLQIIDSISYEDWIKEAKNKQNNRFRNSSPIIYIDRLNVNDFPESIKKLDNCWVLFDRNIEELLKILISNVIHSYESFNITVDGEEKNIDMVIEINYLDSEAKISLKNMIKFIQSVKTIESEFYNKKKYLIDVLKKKLEGDIEFIEEASDGKRKLNIILTIPIIKN